MLMSQAFKIQVHKATSLLLITVCSLLKSPVSPLRFGSRPLPKAPDGPETEGDIPVHSSDAGVRLRERGPVHTALPLEAPCSQTYTTQTAKASRAAGHTQLEAPPGTRSPEVKGTCQDQGPPTSQAAAWWQHLP